MGNRAFAPVALVTLLLVAGWALPAQPAQVNLGASGTLPGNVVGVAVDAAGRVGAAISAGPATGLGVDKDLFVFNLGPGSEGLSSSTAVDTSLLTGKGLAFVTMSVGGDVVAVASPRDSPTKVFVYNVVRNDEVEPSRTFSGGIDALALSADGTKYLVVSGNEVLTAPVGGSSNPTQIYERTAGSIDEVAWTPDLSFIAVAWTDDSNPPTNVRGVDLKRGTSGGTVSSSTLPGTAAVSGLAFAPDAVGFVAAQDDCLWFFTIDSAGAIEKQSSTEPKKGRFQQCVGQALGAVDVAKAGQSWTVAAGGASGAVQVYSITEWDEGSDQMPPPARLWTNPASVAGRVGSVTLSDDAQALYVRSDALSMFHSFQFKTGPAPTPVWTVTGAFVAPATTGDGEVLLTGVGQNVRIYRQVHAADLRAGSATTVDPGSRVELLFDLTNKGSTFDSFDLGVDGAPPGWQVAISPESVDLLPEKTKRLHVNVTLPSSAASGPAVAELVATRAGAEVAAVALPIAVREKATVELLLPRSPQAVEAGQDFVARIGVDNQGNTPVDYVLRATGQFPWETTVDGVDLPYSATAAVGQNQTVEVHIRVRDTASSGVRNPITFRLEKSGGGLLDSGSLVLVVSPDWKAPQIGGGPTTPIKAAAGGTATVTLTLRNVGNTQDTFRIRVDSKASDPQKLWQASVTGGKLADDAVTLEGGASTDLTVTVNVPRGAVKDETASVTLTARSEGLAVADPAAASSDVQFVVQSTGEKKDGSPVPVLVPILAVLAAAVVARRRWRR